MCAYSADYGKSNYVVACKCTFQYEVMKALIFGKVATIVGVYGNPYWYNAFVGNISDSANVYLIVNNYKCECKYSPYPGYSHQTPNKK